MDEVSGTHSVGLHEEPMELRPGNQPAEPGKECSIRGPEDRAGHLSSKDGHLVSKHNDFDGQIRVVVPMQEEDLDGPEEGEIEE